MVIVHPFILTRVYLDKAILYGKTLEHSRHSNKLEKDNCVKPSYIMPFTMAKRKYMTKVTRM